MDYIWTAIGSPLDNVLPPSILEALCYNVMFIEYAHKEDTLNNTG